jgi:hypothetical protein
VKCLGIAIQVVGMVFFCAGALLALPGFFLAEVGEWLSNVRVAR